MGKREIEEEVNQARALTYSTKKENCAVVNGPRAWLEVVSSCARTTSVSSFFLHYKKEETKTSVHQEQARLGESFGFLLQTIPDTCWLQTRLKEE